ncbi:hypothetical protein [Pseudomonas sp.]
MTAFFDAVRPTTFWRRVERYIDCLRQAVNRFCQKKRLNPIYGGGQALTY